MQVLLLVGACHAHLYVVKRVAELAVAGYRVRLLAPSLIGRTGGCRSAYSRTLCVDLDPFPEGDPPLMRRASGEGWRQVSVGLNEYVYRSGWDQPKRLLKTVKANRKVTPTMRKSPLKNHRVTRRLTLPCSPVPKTAPRTDPGTAQTMTFQSMAEKPPSAAS